MMFHVHWKVSIKSYNSPNRARIGTPVLTVVCLLTYFSSPLPAHGQQIRSDSHPDQQWGVLLHSHGSLAHGWDAIVSLQRAAKKNGISAVVLTEQLIAQWNWGPPVVRELWSYRHKLPELPSIRSYGIERYFEQAAEADRLVPEVTLIAAAEVAPYYYWTGVPWKKNLTMWNWQRNLLVLDLPDPSTYGKLPILGLRRSLLQSWKDFLWLGVVIALLVGFLIALNHLYFFRALLALIPAILLLWSGPPPPAPYSPYRQDAGTSPYQAVIDSVDRWGGIILWSMVETVDDHQMWWGGIHTDPHPEVLLQTNNYHGFGVIYADNITAQEPGHEWDQALLDYLDGLRRNPPWGWGEQALHYPEQLPDKTVGGIQTVLFAPDPSEEALMSALRRGRGYSVRTSATDGRLRLDRFEASSGQSRSGMGQWLLSSGQLAIHAAWSYTGNQPPEVTARLIRNGEVIASECEIPPTELVWEEPEGSPPPPSPRPRAFYRLELEGQGHRLLSNPIFVAYTAAGRGSDSP